MNYSIAISESNNQTLINHLVREDGQEDLCFALYAPSTGSIRFSGLIQQIILPKFGERNIHGNASFNSEYFDRVIKLALKEKLGICFMHSHPVSGWQNMSSDDIEAETMLASRVKAVTGLPLLGMTIGTDGTWSARFWIKSKPKQYDRFWCNSVRVIGHGFKIDYCNELLPLPKNREEFTRTISAWGVSKQADIARLKVGIVGIGSVGSIVAESLIRTGIQNIALIDFDTIERKNLDRLHGVSKKNIGQLKIQAYKDLLLENKVSDELMIQIFPYSISEKEGLMAALDCDILFSCVDRPLARFILNKISYANLIPIIDGGIDASINKTKSNIDQARWRSFTIGVQRRCLRCHDQYKEEDVALEMSGLLDDSTYIQELPKEHFVNRGENVFAFSLSLAGMLMQQFLSLILQPRGVYYGAKEMNFVTGNTNDKFEFECEENCDFKDIVAFGDKVNVELPVQYPRAEESRKKALEKEMIPHKVNFWKKIWDIIFSFGKN